MQITSSFSNSTDVKLLFSSIHSSWSLINQAVSKQSALWWMGFHQSVTKLVTSVMRKCQAVVALCGLYRCSWGPWLFSSVNKLLNMSCFFRLQSSDPIYVTQKRVNSSCLALAEKIWFVMGTAHITELCCSTHEYLFSTNVAPFKKQNTDFPILQEQLLPKRKYWPNKV